MALQANTHSYIEGSIPVSRPSDGSCLVVSES